MPFTRLNLELASGFWRAWGAAWVELLGLQRKPPKSEPPQEGSTITPEFVERAIDDVGRDRVFERARQLGWGPGSTPPLWLWWGIVQELRAEANQQQPPAITAKAQRAPLRVVREDE